MSLVSCVTRTDGTALCVSDTHCIRTVYEFSVLCNAHWRDSTLCQTHTTYVDEFSILCNAHWWDTTLCQTYSAYVDQFSTLCSSESCWCLSRTSREWNNRLHNKQVNFGQSVIFSSTAAASHSTCGAVAGSECVGGSGSSSLSLSLSPYDATRPRGPLTAGCTFFSWVTLLYRHFTRRQYIQLAQDLTTRN